MNAMMASFLTFTLRLYRRKTDSQVCVNQDLLVLLLLSLLPSPLSLPSLPLSFTSLPPSFPSLPPLSPSLLHLSSSLLPSLSLLPPQISFFSREMMALLGSEDSGHYMLYTFFFYNQYPTSSESYIQYQRSLDQGGYITYYIPSSLPPSSTAICHHIHTYLH